MHFLSVRTAELDAQIAAALADSSAGSQQPIRQLVILGEQHCCSLHCTGVGHSLLTAQEKLQNILGSVKEAQAHAVYNAADQSKKPFQLRRGPPARRKTKRSNHHKIQQGWSVS